MPKIAIFDGKLCVLNAFTVPCVLTGQVQIIRWSPFFSIEIMKVSVYRNAWTPAGTFGQDWINWSWMNEILLYYYPKLSET